jgi:hypothetical protein
MGEMGPMRVAGGTDGEEQRGRAGSGGLWTLLWAFGVGKPVARQFTAFFAGQLRVAPGGLGWGALDQAGLWATPLDRTRQVDCVKYYY